MRSGAAQADMFGPARREAADVLNRPFQSTGRPASGSTGCTRFRRRGSSLDGKTIVEVSPRLAADCRNRLDAAQRRAIIAGAAAATRALSPQRAKDGPLRFPPASRIASVDLSECAA